MDREKKVFLETKLRNLRRQYAKVAVHGDLTEYAIDLKKEINFIENELDS
jgi:RIO-like serine/threonine protein kinase